MVDTGTALIVGSLIGTCSMLGLYMLSNRMWFKKENFKIEKSNVLATNRIKLSQLKKELGIDETKKKPVDLSSLNLKSLINNPEEEDEDEDEGGITGIIKTVIANNPELVEKYAPELIKLATGAINKDKVDNYI